MNTYMTSTASKRQSQNLNPDPLAPGLTLFHQTTCGSSETSMSAGTQLAPGASVRKPVLENYTYFEKENIPH